MPNALRPHLTYANVCATLALFLALGGISWAASLPRNSVTSATVRNSSLTGYDVKDRSLQGRDVRDSSLNGRDIRDGSIHGRDVANGGLSGFDLAKDSVTGAHVRDITGADIDESTLSGVPVAGFERIAIQRLTATSDPDPAVARQNAPEVTLLSAGSLAITARCLHDDTANEVIAETYVRSSVDGAVVDRLGGTALGGGALASDYLNAGTAAIDRRIQSVSATNNAAAWTSTASATEVAALAPDGSQLRGLTFSGARNGTVAYPAVFGSANRGCVFGGFAATG